MPGCRKAVIISGDNELLSLGRYQEICIQRRAPFLAHNPEQDFSLREIEPSWQTAFSSNAQASLLLLVTA